MISLIVAASSNNVIGSNNRLPWHLPTDMKFFKNTTWGMPVIMGRKTFEAMHKKALPGRKNIVITRQENLETPDAAVVNAFSAALSVAKETDCKEVFVIGGGEIFKEVIEDAATMSDIMPLTPKGEFYVMKYIYYSTPYLLRNDQ